MSKILSKTKTSRTIILLIIFILISVGALTMIIYSDMGRREIDERADWISFTYYAEAGGCKFYFNSKDHDPPLHMVVTDEGWYNITFHYFNGSIASKNVNVTYVSIVDAIFDEAFIAAVKNKVIQSSPPKAPGLTVALVALLGVVCIQMAPLPRSLVRVVSQVASSSAALRPEAIAAALIAPIEVPTRMSGRSPASSRYLHTPHS